jgi:hypothetical protein
MADWFTPEMDPGTLILPSEKGFTTNEIAITFLKHYIEHTDAGPNSPWKLMLMDNHGSHITGEFIKLANENHILPYPLIAHLTHCMQPLDVGIFQVWKHWHDVAIKESLSSFEIEYTLRSFLRDLRKIRYKTFKKKTIKSAFKKSGMWPPDVDQCLKQLKIFSPPQYKLNTEELTLPQLPRTAMQVEGQITGGMEAYCVEKASSPSRDSVKHFFTGAKAILTEAQLKEQQLILFQKRRIEDLERKVVKRRVLAKVGGLTAEEGNRKLADLARQLEEKGARTATWVAALGR